MISNNNNQFVETTEIEVKFFANIRTRFDFCQNTKSISISNISILKDIQSWNPFTSPLIEKRKCVFSLKKM